MARKSLFHEGLSSYAAMSMREEGRTGNRFFVQETGREGKGPQEGREARRLSSGARPAGGLPPTSGSVVAVRFFPHRTNASSPNQTGSSFQATSH